jgi:hypothetical protein
VAVTWDDIVIVAPALATVSVPGQNFYLTESLRQIDPDVWGEFATVGQIYLAAHMATLGQGAGAGPITSETLGAMSRSYAVPLWLRSSLALTRYGAEYDRLLRIAVAVPALVP